MTDYNSDFYLWTQQQAQLLRQGMWSGLDLENLVEEITNMGKSQRDAVASHLLIVMMHLLKWQYQAQRRSASWRDSIVNGRIQIEDLLDNNPSLKPQVPGLIEQRYAKARRYASRETALSLATFPVQCPFSSEQIIGDWWPAP